MNTDPPRLKQSGELGDALAKLAQRAPAPERLERGARALDQVIAAGSSGAASSVLGTLAASWKAASVVGLVIAAGIAVNVGRRVARDPQTAPVIELAIESATEEPASPVDGLQVVHEEPPPTAPVRVDAMVRAIVPVTAAEPAPPPPENTLSVQLTLFDTARAHARAGRHADALATLDQLLARYPATPLRADAALTRAAVLARAGDRASALRAFRELLGDPAHAGRRAELQLVIDDLERQEAAAGKQ